LQEKKAQSGRMIAQNKDSSCFLTAYNTAQQKKLSAKAQRH
jgi:hypothetical protein